MVQNSGPRVKVYTAECKIASTVCLKLANDQLYWQKLDHIHNPHFKPQHIQIKTQYSLTNYKTINHDTSTDLGGEDSWLP